MNKTCRGCANNLPVENFYVHVKMAGGYLNFCKACVCFRIRKYRFHNETPRLYDKRRFKEPLRRATQYTRNTNYRSTNPEKYKARYAVNNAVRDGRLIKPTICSACTKPGYITGHHKDYTKPLDVIWLCARCHARLEKGKPLK